MKYVTYTTEEVHNALLAYAEKMNISEVSRDLNIPFSTLKRWLDNNKPKIEELRRVIEEKKKKEYETQIRNKVKLIVDSQLDIAVNTARKAKEESENGYIRPEVATTIQKMSVANGTMIDKQLIIEGKANTIVKGNFSIQSIDDF